MSMMVISGWVRAGNGADVVLVVVEHGAAGEYDRRPAVLQTLGQVAIVAAVNVIAVAVVHVTGRCAVREAVVVIGVEELREVRRVVAVLAAES